jgi:UDP-N-acetylmuramoyl-tripeptide--D-alanyl-D-alanine ligase
MKLKLNEVYRVFNTGFSGTDAAVAGICTDTRKIKKGDIFFALIGETDGHMYAAKAFNAGAAALVVQKYAEGVEIARQIKVKDTTAALLTLASYYYGKFSGIKCAAVTGSNGKTTTKELLAAILGEKYQTLKSEKSFNNAIGLPQTIFRLDKKTEAAVFEIGMNHAGEIKNLVSAIEPGVAVITNIGRAHIGFFRDGLAGIARAKAEIFTGVKAGGTAVLNADDRFFGFLAGKAKKKKLKIVTFGLKNQADVKVESFEPAGNGTGFRVNCLKEKLFMKLKGEHNLYNAAAAIAAALALDVPGAAVKKGLGKFEMEGFMRFEEIRLKSGALLINDCYNANPDSFTASIEAVKKEGFKPLIAVMGDMLELGKNAASMHVEIGKKFRELPLKKFFVYGSHAGSVKKGYGAGAEIYKDRAKLGAALKASVKKGDTVFVKGSRGNKLEEITEILK